MTQYVSFNAAGLSSSSNTADRPKEIFFYHFAAIQNPLLLQTRWTFKQSGQNTGGKKPTEPNNFYFVEETQMVLIQTGSTFCYVTSVDTSSSTLLLRAYSDSQLDLHRHLLSDQVYIRSKQQRQTISPATTFINNELGYSKKRLRKMTAEFLKDVKERRGNEGEIHNGQNNFCKDSFLAFKTLPANYKIKNVTLYIVVY